MTESNGSKLFSVEAETQLLSLFLSSPELIYETTDLKRDMFVSTPNQILYGAMYDLSRDGVLPSAVVLEEYLRSKGSLENAGGKETIKFLDEKSLDKSNYKVFEKSVVNSYLARGMLQMNSKIPGMIQNTENPEQVISYMRSYLDSLTEYTGGSKTSKIDAILPGAWKEIRTRVDNPGLRGFPTGFTSLDHTTGGIVPGDMWVVAGRPSHGKSSLIINSILNVALHNGLVPLIFSKEMSTQSLIERMVSIDTGIALHGIRTGQLETKDIDKLMISFKKLESCSIFIDGSFTSDLNYMLSTIRKFSRVEKVNVVYIDYVQLIAERSGNAVHEIGQISRALKLLANELGISIYLVSQLNRLVEAREDKRPLLADLRQSGNLEEDADVVLMLYYDKIYKRDSIMGDIIEVIIRKNRNGPIGKIDLQFIPETTGMIDVKNPIRQ